MIRVGLDRSLVGMSNPNTVGNWFGFLTVYFFVFGLVNKRERTRFVCWGLAIGCLFIVTLTVSRAALLSTIIALILGSREILNRGISATASLFCVGMDCIWVGAIRSGNHVLCYAAYRGKRTISCLAAGFRRFHKLTLSRYRCIECGGIRSCGCQKGDTA